MASEKRVVYLHLLDDCNLNCKHCYLGPPSKRTHSLTLPQIKAALSYYHDQNFETVFFRGGEAYLSPHLKRAVTLAKKTGFRTVGIHTNGSYPKIIDMFTPKEVTYFHFGLDGANPKTNDSIRGQGHFEKCLASIRKAVEKGFIVRVSCCVTNNNKDEIKELAHLLDELGVSSLNLNFTSFIGNAIHHPEIIISPKEWMKVGEEAKKITGLKNLTIHFPEMFVGREKYRQLLKEGYHCLIRELEKRHANVFASGLVFSCSLITESEELATHLLTKKGITPQIAWEKLLTGRYPQASCPVQEFLRDKYSALPREEDIVPVCVYWEKFSK